MNSKELREEIEKIEQEMKSLLANNEFRNFLARMNYLHGAIEAAKNIFTRLEEKEKSEIKTEVQEVKNEVKEGVDKALT